MANNVNLDALIPREDFDALVSSDDAQFADTLRIQELEDRAFFYRALRKPDFQRESSEWDAKRVVELVTTFIKGDLIPSVILWNHQGHVFVIDGAHRLSALIAWVFNDYGDGEKSQRYYGQAIPKEQLDHADRTRKLIQKEIGSYQDHLNAAVEPDQYGPDMVARSRALATRVLNLQWVRGSSAEAESSFIRINRQAANISPQELTLIRRRKKPDVIAARSVLGRGVVASRLPKAAPETMAQIKTLSAESYHLLFEPELSYPIKSLNLPAAGSVYSGPTLKMMHDFVQIVSPAASDEDDLDGIRTLETLKRVRRGAELLCSNSVRSLGLHPAVYFYSWTGKHQPILFLTMAEIIVETERKSKLPVFIKRRAVFEQFIQNHRALLNQIIRKFGTKDSGQNHLKRFYEQVFEAIDSGLGDADIVNRLIEHKDFTYLQPGESPYAGVSATRYAKHVKSGLIMNELLPNELKCVICRGLVPSQAISIDHEVRREDGGESNVENLRITHGYCNSGIKEAQVHRDRAGH